MEKIILIEHLTNELNYINRYQQELDSNHNIFFALGLGIFGAFFMTGFGEDGLPMSATMTIFMILLIMSVFTVLIYYAAYRLRMVAILRGRAKAIEMQINTIVRSNCYQWNSYYIQKFINKNNAANTFLFVPVVVLYLLIAGMCFVVVMQQDVDALWHWLSYSFIIANIIGSIFAFVSIGKNDKMFRKVAAYTPDKTEM